MNKYGAGWLLALFLVVEGSAEEGSGENVRQIPFQLVQQHGSLCLEVESRDSEYNSCIYSDLEDNGRCYPRNRAVMKTCVEKSSEQDWSYNPERLFLHYGSYSKALCLTRMVRSVEMLPCESQANLA